MLSGFKVVDLTKNLSGPFCTMILADMGATVIKVENPPYGDDARIIPPFIKGESAYFLSINRGKKSITLNLKSEEGKKILASLIQKSDVLIENNRPGVMERLGFSYNTVKKINAQCIMASISGFGQYGPDKDKRAYDMVVQGYGGIMSITGTTDGGPVRVGYSIADLAAGLYAATSILGALIARSKTNEGQHIDLSMLDCQIALMENAVVRYSVTGNVPMPIGGRHPSLVPFQAFKAHNGYFTVAIANERLFKSLCKVLNVEQLIEDGRFATNAERVNNHGTLENIFNKIFETKNKEHWINVLEDAGIPCGPINDVVDLFQSPHVKARNMLIETEHYLAGKVITSGSPIKTSNGDVVSMEPAPILGQHNEEILRGLGLTTEEIMSLKGKGVL